MANSLTDITGELIGVTASDEVAAPNFDEVPFWVEPESDPELDSFVVIKRQGEVLQFGRIHGGKEESDRSDPQRQQRDTSMEFKGRDIRESSLAPDVVRTEYIDLLGEIILDPDEREDYEDEYSVRRPTKLPQVGREVYKLGASHLPDLLNIPKPDDEEGLHIGEIESGGETVDFMLDRQSLSRHIAILGRTGTGKTHTAHVVIEELVKQNIPVITFDLEDDVGPMAEDLGGITLDPQTDDLTIPFHFIGWNEFERFLGDMPSKKQMETIGYAYSRVRSKALQELEESGTIEVGAGEFAEEIEDAADELDYSRFSGPSKGRAFAAIKRSNVLGYDINNWEDLLLENPIVNIDLGEVSDAERGMVISALARMLQRLREREEVPPFVLGIDEAHEFVPAGGGESTEIVRDLVKTARHIEVGVMLMSQSPSELDDKTLRTCNTYVVMALAEGEVRRVKGLLADLTEKSLQQIPDMEIGRAFIGSARDIMLHTVPVDIRDRDTPDGAETPDLATSVREYRDERGGEKDE